MAAGLWLLASGVWQYEVYPAGGSEPIVKLCTDNKTSRSVKSVKMMD